MIPVFQTRYAAETFGNCFEACIASILELPLAAIPDRAELVDHDAWADLCTRTRVAGGEQAVLDLDLPDEYDVGETGLRQWLATRGLAWLDIRFGTGRNECPPGMWLESARVVFADGYWIGHTRQKTNGTLHATVWRSYYVVHNPSRGGTLDMVELGELHAATLLVAGNPALLARRLDPLPDVAAELERALA